MAVSDPAFDAIFEAHDAAVAEWKAAAADTSASASLLRATGDKLQAMSSLLIGALAKSQTRSTTPLPTRSPEGAAAMVIPITSSSSSGSSPGPALGLAVQQCSSLLLLAASREEELRAMREENAFLRARSQSLTPSLATPASSRSTGGRASWSAHTISPDFAPEPPG